MRDLYIRARAHTALTPGERALLKLIEGLLCAGVVAALPVISGALGHSGVHWADVARTALAAGSVAALLALAKYAKAHGDPLLGDALAGVATDLTPNPSPVGEGSRRVLDAGLSDASAGDGIPVEAGIPAQPPEARQTA